MIAIPNTLGDDAETAEDCLRAVAHQSDIQWDLSAVEFVRPHGVIALICAARAHHTRTGDAIALCHLRERVHQYLERVGLFDVCAGIIHTPDALSESWDHAQPTPNLLELTRIRGAADLIDIITRAEAIFSYWLPVRNLRALLGVLSELCANVYQHSGDPDGVLLIQTHQAVSRGEVRVRVAIGDVGIGVRGSLRGRHGDLGDNAVDYLTAALGGRTARHTGRGGMGLRIVEQTVGAGGGYMRVRSEDAAITTDGTGAHRVQSQLTYLPGTQVTVEFHAPLPD